MFEMKEYKFSPENFHRGHFPAVREAGTVKSGAEVRQFAPVVKNDDGTLQEAAAATLEKLVGIAADPPDAGGNLVYYETGDFFAQGVVLPTGVTLEALVPACRKLSIFLK